MDNTGWERVAEHVVHRRVELGMATAKALADATGLTPRVIGDIENARRTNYSVGTRAQIEQALQWSPGSIELILIGRSPRPAAESAVRVLDKDHRLGLRMPGMVPVDALIGPLFLVSSLREMVSAGVSDGAAEVVDQIRQALIHAIGEASGPDALIDLAGMIMRTAGAMEEGEGNDHQPGTENSTATQPRTQGEAREDEKTRHAPTIKTRAKTPANKPTDLSERRSRREAGSPAAENLTTVPDENQEELPEDAIAARTRDPRFAPDDPAGFYGTNDIGEENQDTE